MHSFAKRLTSPFKYNCTIISFIAFLVISSCSTRTIFNEQYVTGKIQEQAGLDTSSALSGPLDIPGDIVLSDGISLDEANEIALWKNPKLQADMADLGFARADLLDAGMLPNPALSLLFPIGPKQLEFTFSYAIDVLWQRPGCISAARLNVEKTANNLVRNGLSLIREVSVAYADLIQAEGELEVYNEQASGDREVARIAGTRLNIGDISSLEEMAFRLESSRSDEAALNAKKELENRKARFFGLLGLVDQKDKLEITVEDPVLVNLPDTGVLIANALAARPDFRAAEIEVEISADRLGWERSKIISLTALLDANAQGKEGFEMGPGMQLAIPLFNFNQGGTRRARAMMQKAAAGYLATEQNIYEELLISHNEYTTACELYWSLAENMLPVSEKALESAEKSWIAGEIS